MKPAKKTTTAKQTARKTPRHVLVLMELHRRMLDGFMNDMPEGPIYRRFGEIGVAIEKALATCGVNPRGELIDAQGGAGWVFTGVEHRGEPSQGPKSAEAFRRMCHMAAGWLLFDLHHLAGYKSKGAAFRYDDETIEAIRIQAAKIRDFLRDGRILKLRDPIDTARMDKVRAAEFDSSFQKFLRQLPAMPRGATKAQLEYRTTLVQKGRGPTEGETV